MSYLVYITSVFAKRARPSRFHALAAVLGFAAAALLSRVGLPAELLVGVLAALLFAGIARKTNPLHAIPLAVAVGVLEAFMNWLVPALDATPWEKAAVATVFAAAGSFLVTLVFAFGTLGLMDKKRFPRTAGVAVFLTATQLLIHYFAIAAFQVNVALLPSMDLVWAFYVNVFFASVLVQSRLRNRFQVLSTMVLVTFFGKFFLLVARSWAWDLKLFGPTGFYSSTASVLLGHEWAFNLLLFYGILKVLYAYRETRPA